MGDALTSDWTQVSLGAWGAQPLPGQGRPPGLGRSAAGARVPTPPALLSPSPRRWRLVARRRPAPAPPLTSGRQALWDWLRLCTIFLQPSDWLQGARNGSPDWLNQGACAAGFSAASHSWEDSRPAGRFASLLRRGPGSPGKAAAAAP